MEKGFDGNLVNIDVYLLVVKILIFIIYIH